MQEIEKYYSNDLKRLIDFMQTKLIEDIPTTHITTEYFIIAALELKDSKIYKLLSNTLSSITLNNIYQSYYDIVRQKSLTALNPKIKPVFSPDFKLHITNALKECENLGEKLITTEHVMLAMLNPNNPTVNKLQTFFNTIGLTYYTLHTKLHELKSISTNSEPLKFNEIVDTVKKLDPTGEIVNIINQIREKEETAPIISMIGIDKGTNDGSNNRIQFINGNNILGIGNNNSSNNKESVITQYTTNVSELAEKGDLEKLVGREKEINQILRVIGRKNKNNAILVGNPGCGKSKIGEGLALAICNGDVPNNLKNKKIISLNLTSLIAGTHFRGMFEERVKNLINDLKSKKNYILFIDDIHNVFSDRQKNDVDISAMLMPILTNKNIQVIGTTNFKDYRNVFETNSNLSHKFQKIIIEPTTIEETYNILLNIKEYYETYHNVIYTNESLLKCSELANKYIPERNLPDSAIDIMDEVGADFNMKLFLDKNINDIKKQLLNLKQEREQAIYNDDFDKVDKIVEEENKLKVLISEKEDEFIKNENRTVYPEDIYRIISEKTGIPITSLTKDDKTKLSNIGNILKEKVIGQNEAIETIARTMKRNRLGLSEHKKCQGSFFFIGTTGCGKTYLAKQLAKEIFGDEKYLVRLDMSEYADKTAINKLIGSNPGYIGYEKGGQLTEIIKNKKYCVLLLDEFEKADSEIANTFLQVLDEGHLTDNSGQKIDFKNTIIIFTSNIGTKEANSFGRGMDFKDNQLKNKKNIIERELKNKFPPEFINRIDNVIYFNSLSDDNLKDIIRLELNNLCNRVLKINFNLKYDESVVNILFNKIIKDKEYGARPILRIIQNEIENKLTDLILENDYEENYTFTVVSLDDLNIYIY